MSLFYEIISIIINFIKIINSVVIFSSSLLFIFITVGSYLYFISNILIENKSSFLKESDENIKKGDVLKAVNIEVYNSNPFKVYNVKINDSHIGDIGPKERLNTLVKSDNKLRIKASLFFKKNRKNYQIIKNSYSIFRILGKIQIIRMLNIIKSSKWAGKTLEIYVFDTSFSKTSKTRVTLHSSGDNILGRTSIIFDFDNHHTIIYTLFRKIFGQDTNISSSHQKYRWLIRSNKKYKYKRIYPDFNLNEIIKSHFTHQKIKNVAFFNYNDKKKLKKAFKRRNIHSFFNRECFVVSSSKSILYEELIRKEIGENTAIVTWSGIIYYNQNTFLTIMSLNKAKRKSDVLGMLFSAIDEDKLDQNRLVTTKNIFLLIKEKYLKIL